MSENSKFLKYLTFAPVLRHHLVSITNGILHFAKSVTCVRLNINLILLYNPGRPKVNVDGFESLYEKTQTGELTVSKAALQLGISRRTWYNLVMEVEK